MNEEKKDTKFKSGSLWKGNASGRPKGSKSLKTFAQEYLLSLSDEDKIEYLNSIDPELVWKMAEGNPKQDNSVTISDITDYASLRNTPTDTLLTKVNDN